MLHMLRHSCLRSFSRWSPKRPVSQNLVLGFTQSLTCLEVLLKRTSKVSTTYKIIAVSSCISSTHYCRLLFQRACFSKSWGSICQSISIAWLNAPRKKKRNRRHSLDWLADGKYPRDLYNGPNWQHSNSITCVAVATKLLPNTHRLFKTQFNNDSLEKTPLCLKKHYAEGEKPNTPRLSLSSMCKCVFVCAMCNVHASAKPQCACKAAFFAACPQ